MPAGFGQRARPFLTWRSLEEGELAARSEAETRVSICCCACAARPSRLLALRATSGRVVADGVASRRIRTDQVLARHNAGRYCLGGTGAFGETSLDYRAGLSRIETGTRPGSL